MTKPKECPEDQRQEKEGKAQADVNRNSPIIDVFLNPERSDELKKLLKFSQDNQASADKVTTLIKGANIGPCKGLGGR